MCRHKHTPHCSSCFDKIHSQKNNIGERVYLAYSSKWQSVTGDAASHIHREEQREMHAWVLTCAQPPIYTYTGQDPVSREWRHPQWVNLSKPINTIKRVSHRLTWSRQSLIETLQVILDCIELIIRSDCHTIQLHIKDRSNCSHYGKTRISMVKHMLNRRCFH